MAVVNPIYLVEYNSPAGAGTVLEVTNSGTNELTPEPELQGSGSTWVYRYYPFQWGGNIYLPGGSSYSSSWGMLKFNPRSSKFDHWGITKSVPMPLSAVVGDRVAQANAASFWSGPSPDWITHKYTSSWTRYLMCINDEVVHFSTLSARHMTWEYPFTATPSQFTSQPYLEGLATFKGDVYGVDITTGTSYLHKFNSGFSQVGSGFTLDDATYVVNSLDGVSLFEWHDKLWLIVSYDNASASAKHRCYEVDTSAGTVTERATYVPSAWSSGGQTGAKMFEVIDDTSGSSRKVFLVSHLGSSGTWQMYEFNGDEGAWPSIASGASPIFPGGVVWDRTKGQAGSVVGLTDSSPSSHATLDLKVANLIDNDTVDLEINYRNLTAASGSMAPPYSECTGYSGSSSSGLSSAPSASSLSDLSDDFADGVIDEDLWHKTAWAWQYNSDQTDFGVGRGDPAYLFFIDEGSGRISFGRSSGQTGSSYHGAALRGKWSISGDFQIDLTLDNLAALRAGTAWNYCIGCMVKVGTSKGCGFWVADNSSTLQAMGIQYKIDAASVVSASNPTVADDDVIRISRASNVWAVTYDPGGGGETDITPAGGVSYSEDVTIWIGGLSYNTTSWATATPGPGFSDLSVSGSGSLGTWEPGQGYDQTFDWDHIADLGAGFNGGVQFATRLK